MELIPGLPNDIARECLIRVPYTSFSSAVAACKQWKDEIESREFQFSRRSNGRSQFVLVVTQLQPEPARSPGCPKLPHALSCRLSAFDPVSGSWWDLPPLPGCTNGIPMFCQLAAAGSNLVVVGGLDPVTWEASGSVYVYSFVFGVWRRGAEMPGVRRSFFACTSDGRGMVFVAGGHDREKNALRSAVAYEMAADRWLAMPDMAEERDECKGMFIHGRFLVLGGYPTKLQGGFVKSAEEFNVATGRWCSVRDNVLESSASLMMCVATGVSNVALYTCRDRVVLGVNEPSCDQARWRVVARLPADMACPAHVATWQGKVMVIGSARFGEPHKVYLLEVNNNNNNNNNNWSAVTNENGNDSFGKCTWTRVEFEDEDKFSGHVLSGCLVEI